MNKKLLSLLIVVFTGLLFLTGGVLIAADVPDEVSIDNQVYKKDKKGPVKLLHKKHSTDYKVACADCHHDYKDGKNCWKEGDPVKKCGECHDPVKKDGEAMKLQNAFHKNCKDCHKALVKDGKSDKAPFKKCNNCHAKK